MVYRIRFFQLLLINTGHLIVHVHFPYFHILITVTVTLK